VVALFERKHPMPEDGENEASSEAEPDSSYQAWLRSEPVPGEVFVDTGEASAADSRKLRWSPNKAQREMIKDAITHELAIVNELYQDDAQESYAGHIEGLVDHTLRSVGVDPATLRSLPDAPNRQAGR
jgi:hypothetical protein